MEDINGRHFEPKSKSVTQAFQKSISKGININSTSESRGGGWQSIIKRPTTLHAASSLSTAKADR